LESDGVIHILAGSTLGLITRMFIRYIPIRQRFSLNNTLIVNVLASLYLGIFIALDITNKNLILFFSVGFLGCFSTFSSFIYQLFNLIQKRKYLCLLIYYVEFLFLSFLSFCVGYFFTLIIKN